MGESSLIEIGELDLFRQAGQTIPVRVVQFTDGSRRTWIGGSYDYTFVGNVSERFERINHVPPVASEELADMLRDHDIYITGSKNDPCSNALIEALSCRLPANHL